MSPSASCRPALALRYGIAVVIGVLGFLLAAALPVQGSLKLPLIACYTVLILVSAAIGGFGPGLVCTMLCAVAVVYWLEPQGLWAVAEPAEIFGIVLFVLSGMIVSGISERMHSATRVERAGRLLAEQATQAEQAAREIAVQAVEASQAAQRAREELLAVVAHDLRDPLGVIDLNAGLIEKLAGEDEQVRRRTAILHRTAQRMSRLVRDLLESSALAAGKFSIELDTHSAASILAQTVEEHEPEARVKSVRLDQEVPRDLPLIVCDRDRVLQVLSNLVTNAMHFTPAGGRVLLRADALDGFVRVTVSDTGSGISPALLPHIFEPFSRERRLRGGRTGLGLSIAKAVIERHGGTIDVASEPGAGTTFSLTLPTAPAQAA